MSEQKIGCVPDGYMPIPTAEQLADALENVRSFHDMSAELIAPELLANLLASPTVKAEPAQCTNEDSWNCKYCRKTETCEALADKRNFGTPATSLPAAGSAEQVEVVAWLDEGPEQPDCTASRRVMMDWANCGYTIQPLMTVAQHERIVAVLRAQISERDAAIEEWSGTAVQNGMEVDRLSAALSAQQSAHVSVPVELLRSVCSNLPEKMKPARRELRALLASHGRGEA